MAYFLKISKPKTLETKELGMHLRALALTEDAAPFLSNNIAAQVISNSNTTEFNAIFCLPLSPDIHMVHTHIYI